MTDIGTIAKKCSNSKCICQTLNKFSAFIALNSNLRLITDNLSLVAVIFGSSSLDTDRYRDNCNEMFKFEVYLSNAQ